MGGCSKLPCEGGEILTKMGPYLCGHFRDRWFEQLPYRNTWRGRVFVSLDRKPSGFLGSPTTFSRNSTTPLLTEDCRSRGTSVYQNMTLGPKLNPDSTDAQKNIANPYTWGP